MEKIVEKSGTEIIPIYEIFRNPDRPDDIRAKAIRNNSFWYIQKTELNDYLVSPVEYDTFYQWQMYNEELDRRTKELLEQDEGIDFDPEVKALGMSQEEEMTYLRASDLYHIILEEWDTIVLGRPSGEFVHDMQLEIEQEEYMERIVLERAWEVNDIITTFVNGGYQPETLFGNYKKIYEDINTTNGKDRARNLIRLARLMGKCVTPEVVQRKQELVESVIPGTANIQDA